MPCHAHIARSHDAALAATGLRVGNSVEFVSGGGDSSPVTVHGVTKAASFASYRPAESLATEGYSEFIELKFGTAVYPSAVRIGENRQSHPPTLTHLS
jgi:hypothetical protein